jgi:hypothetical protein
MVVSAAQLMPIPPRQLGWPMQNSSALVEVLFIGDLMCSDCQAAHPIFKEVIASYPPSQVGAKVFLMPLPYHLYVCGALCPAPTTTAPISSGC